MHIHRLFFLAVCMAAFLASSCNKSNDRPEEETPAGDYYIRYKANGVSHVYTDSKLIHAVFLKLPETGANQYLINGRLHAGDQNRDAVFIVITDDKPLKTGTVYRLGNWLEWPEHNQSAPQVAGSYYNASGEKYFAQLRQLGLLPFEVKDDATAQLSQITDKAIKGTFSMRAFTTYPDLREVMITEGEFHVPVLASNQ